MRRVIVNGLAIIGGLVVLIILIGVGLSFSARGSIKSVPQKTVLEIDFERMLSEHTGADSVLELLHEPALTLRDVVEALERATADERVVALVARVGTLQLGLAQLQEIRDAVLAFRHKGKRAIAYAETFGEFGPGNGAYYLATAFESIYLQPSGDVGLTGLIFETPFVKSTLDKLAVVPRMDHRQEYKNFMNTFTESAYTAPHREAMQQVMTSQFGQILQGIAKARGLDEEVLRTRIDSGPFLGQEAVAAQLVDGLAYRDEVYARLKVDLGQDTTLLYLSHYLARAGRPHTDGTTVALIYGVGPVQRGKSGYDPMSDGPTMGADTVTAAFRAAIKDSKVKAIVFRVDSPGGSYVASDAIWRQTLLARDAGKPVIVSMGNVAGSGGYFVAMAAHKIVAQPGTITGSIGVLGGKMLTAELWQKLGLSWDEVHTSANATMWTGTHDYTPEQWARFQAWLDRVYDDFTSKVAKGRHLPKEKVLEIAKGRIWTGEDAKALGLVDELGGFPVALQLAREAAGLSSDAKLRLEVFPRPLSAVEKVWQWLAGEERENSESRVLQTLLTPIRQRLAPVAPVLRHLGWSPYTGVLSMPAFSSGDL